MAMLFWFLEEVAKADHFSLVDKGRKIAVEDHLQRELDLLRDICRHHGYALNDINRVIYRKSDEPTQQEEEENINKGVAVIPFCGLVPNCITCILQHQIIKTSDQTHPED